MVSALSLYLVFSGKCFVTVSGLQWLVLRLYLVLHGKSFVTVSGPHEVTLVSVYSVDIVVHTLGTNTAKNRCTNQKIVDVRIRQHAEISPLGQINMQG